MWASHTYILFLKLNLFSASNPYWKHYLFLLKTQKSLNTLYSYFLAEVLGFWHIIPKLKYITQIIIRHCVTNYPNIWQLETIVNMYCSPEFCESGIREQPNWMVLARGLLMLLTSPCWLPVWGYITGCLGVFKNWWLSSPTEWFIQERARWKWQCLLWHSLKITCCYFSNMIYTSQLYSAREGITLWRTGHLRSWKLL